MPSKMKTQAAAIAIAREMKTTLRLVFNIPSVWATYKTPEKKLYWVVRSKLMTETTAAPSGAPPAHFISTPTGMLGGTTNDAPAEGVTTALGGASTRTNCPGRRTHPALCTGFAKQSNGQDQFNRPSRSRRCRSDWLPIQIEPTCSCKSRRVCVVPCPAGLRSNCTA
jgi:hypothetical protein